MTRPLLALLSVAAAVACGSPTQQPTVLLPPSSTATPKTSPSPATPRATATRASRTRPSLPRSLQRTAVQPLGSGSLLTTTAYCETGLMANGHRTHRGAVAANRWPLGTRLHVSDSPYGAGIFTVEDRYGHGTQLDFATPGDCALARAWGRRHVHVQALP